MVFVRCYTRIVFILILAGLLAGLLAGCGVCIADETRTITDITGNQVTIPANVTRAVNIDPFTAQFLYVIGADTQLVGTTFGPGNVDVLKTVEPYLSSLPTAGHKDNLNKEQLMVLEPQVVISTVDYPNANEDQAVLGLPYVILDFESVDNLVATVRILGQVFGKETGADEFISYYNEKMDMLRSDLLALPEEGIKSVYFAQRKPAQTLGDDYYEADIVAIAGADNVAQGISGGDNVVSMDQIYTWNPDVIILLPYCSANVSTILEDPAWQALPAVQNKKVYRMPKYLMTWEMPVPESVLATMWMENTLYPEYVSYDLNEEIQEFYEKWYHLTLTDEDISTILADTTPTTCG